MSPRIKKLSTDDLLDKIEWEGGIGSTIEYGLSYKNIADPKLAELWKAVEGPYKKLLKKIERLYSLREETLPAEVDADEEYGDVRLLFEDDLDDDLDDNY